MEDIKILEAVEKYISGQMSPDERVAFELLRKSKPEVDQLVVEHTYFLQQLNRFDEIKNFKEVLNETHIHLAEDGIIKSPKLAGKAKVIYLFNKYKRVAAIAASIAGITALTISALVWSLSPGKNVTSGYQQLSREINDIKNHNKKLDTEIKTVKNTIATTPPVNYTTGGTGFLVDVKGYIVTNAHVIEGAENIAVQNSTGKELKAKVVYTDQAKDLSILKIDDQNYKSPSSIPYALRRSSADISEPIFTLGYPRNDIVYGEGYLAAKTGFDGDTLSCQISIAANRGNSGSPVINRKGEIIGVLNAKQTTEEGAVFAVQSKYIVSILNKLQKSDSSLQRLKIPSGSSLKGLDRTQQVKKISDYIYMVKVD
ncbi:MAG: S1C family serine protease [Candidatus Dadabacteria bacterium]